MASFVLAATLAAVLPAVRKVTPDPTTVALRALVDRELHVANDLLKYSGSSLAPITIATTVPIPNGSSVPVTLQLQTSILGTSQVQNTLLAMVTLVTISARDTSGKHAIQSQATIVTRAP